MPGIEAVYLMDYETFEDVTADLPRFIDEVYKTNSTPRSATKPGTIRGSSRPADGQNRRMRRQAAIEPAQFFCIGGCPPKIE